MKSVESEIREIFDVVQEKLSKKEKDLFWVMRYRTLNPKEASLILGIPRTTFLYRKENLLKKLRILIIEEFGKEKIDAINERFFKTTINE